MKRRVETIGTRTLLKIRRSSLLPSIFDTTTQPKSHLGQSKEKIFLLLKILLIQKHSGVLGTSKMNKPS